MANSSAVGARRSIFARRSVAAAPALILFAPSRKGAVQKAARSRSARHGRVISGVGVASHSPFSQRTDVRPNMRPNHAFRAVRCQDADELGKLLRQVGRPGRSTAERPTRPNSKGCSAPSEARRPSQ